MNAAPTLITAIFCIALSAPAAAEVYKWQGPDGRTLYSDRPQAGASTMPMPSRPAAEDSGETDDSPKASAFLGPFDSFEVMSPEENQTFHTDEGKVPVSLLIEPGLEENEQISIIVDRSASVTTTDQLQFSLGNLTLGTHRLQVEVMAEGGETIARSPSVTFHIKRPESEELP